MFFHKDDQKFATELSDPDQRVETLHRLRMARNLLFFGLICSCSKTNSTRSSLLQDSIRQGRISHLA